MIICKEINDYIDYVKKNPNKINKERKLLIKNIVKPLLKRDDVFFDSEMFDKCIKYCESNYYPLFPFQKFFYAFFFIYESDKKITPFYRTFVFVEGRGNGKDGLMMPLCNFFQTPIYGIKNYNIDIVATSEEQAKDSFGVVYDMLKDNPKFKGKFYSSLEVIKNTITNSILRYNTSNAKTKDGKKSGLVLFNEYHGYEDYKQINVFESGLGKIPHPRKVIITTNGHFRDGPLDELLDLCNEILKTGENDLGYFPFICKLDNAKEADDESKWIKANPSIEFMPVLKDTIKKDYLEMQRLPTKKVEFMTKRMNLPARDDEVTVASWEKILRSTYEDIEDKTPRKIPDLEGRNCIIGIDYADIRDFASAGLLFKVEGEYIWLQHTWICSRSPFFKSIKFPFANAGQEEFKDFSIVDENSIPIANIIMWCVEQMKHYNCQKIIMDTYRFNLFRLGFEEVGLSIEDRKNPFGMVRMIRHLGSINNLTAPLIEQSFSDEKLNFGHSAIMRWYTNNTSVRIDKFGNKMYGKIEPKLRKNDGFMAFVVAMSATNLLDEIILNL